MSEPLWTDKRINDAWEECRLDERINGPVWEMQEEYEAERTKSAAKIAELESELAKFKQGFYHEMAADVAMTDDLAKQDERIVQLETDLAMKDAKVAQFKKNEELFRLWTRDEFSVTDEQIDDLLGIPHGYPDILASLEARIFAKDMHMAELEAERAKLAEVNAAQAARIAELEAHQRPSFVHRVEMLASFGDINVGDILEVTTMDMLPNGYFFYRVHVPSRGPYASMLVAPSECVPVVEETNND